MAAVASVSNFALPFPRRRSARAPAALGRSPGHGAEQQLQQRRRLSGTDLGCRIRLERRTRRRPPAAAHRQEQDTEETAAAEGEDEKSPPPPLSSPKISSYGRRIRQNGGPRRSPWRASHIAKEWASFTGPRENGDVRDVVLMSFSFAVLIYISQHLVHAYCALRPLYHTRF